MSSQSRQPGRVPRGTPTGGQFAATAHGEADVALGAPTRPPVSLGSAQARETQAALDRHRAAILHDVVQDGTGGRWPAAAREAYDAAGTAQAKVRDARAAGTDLTLTEAERAVTLVALEAQQRRVIAEASEEARRAAQTSGRAGTWSPAAREALDALRSAEEQIATAPASATTEDGGCGWCRRAEDAGANLTVMPDGHRAGCPRPDAAEPGEVPTILPPRSPFADLHTRAEVEDRYGYLTEPEILYCDGERSPEEARAAADRLHREARQRLTELEHWQAR
jgi:hypothetical protein